MKALCFYGLRKAFHTIVFIVGITYGPGELGRACNEDAGMVAALFQAPPTLLRRSPLC